jgi:vitamin B12 transporter
MNSDNCKPVTGNFFKTHLLSISLILLFFSATCYAQSEEEMQFLRMFYKDKDLVVSSTRNEKSISQVAENITVITAEDIENMNAHTLADVLIRVPGLFIVTNQDFGAASLLAIQGSEQRHVLVLVDEMPWNSISGGTAETSSIPIGAIERIEIIKGPASSAWGSSLGGVINVITKRTGNSEKPSGSVSASYGKASSQDYRAELSGAAGKVGYYLYAGDQTSNGLVPKRSFDGKKVFAKIDAPISQKGNLAFEIGYNSSDIEFGDLPELDLTSGAGDRTYYTKGTFKLSLVEGLDLKVSFFDMRSKTPLVTRGLGLYNPQGTLIQEIIFDQKRTGAISQLVLTTKHQTTVFGLDYDYERVNQTILNGQAFQMFYGLPAKAIFSPDTKQWAAYANDSISIGKWSITPGVRYDHDSNTGGFLSPNLGSTYQLGKETIIRGAISRGFTSPALSEISGGGLYVDPNPSLKPEEIWSYQAGVETSAIPYVWTKASIFHHTIDDIRVLTNEGPPNFRGIVINGGKSRRQGFEVEAATIPIQNISLSAGCSYTYINPRTIEGASKIHSVDTGIVYNDNESMQAQLHGQYRWWDFHPSVGTKYDDFIWDFNISKKIMACHGVTPEVFFTAHNIFNGLQYLDSTKINPGRWLEAGVKFHF